MLDQSQSPLMPATSASSCTLAVSTTIPYAAPTDWTTEFWQLDTALTRDLTTGSSRTAGELAGVSMATS